MKKFMVAGGVLAALVVGIVAVAGAGAQEATPEGDTAAAEGDRPADHYLELLADNLGVTVEELEGALSQSHIDLINEKVADGTITEEEAAEIIERIESGEGRLFPPFGRGQHGGHHSKFHRLVGMIVANSAEVLDMELEVLKEELHAGNSLADVATAQGVEVERREGHRRRDHPGAGRRHPREDHRVDRSHRREGAGRRRPRRPWRRRSPVRRSALRRPRLPRAAGRE